MCRRRRRPNYKFAVGIFLFNHKIFYLHLTDLKMRRVLLIRLLTRTIFLVSLLFAEKTKGNYH